MRGGLRIGIDFDNTIVSYDKVIHQVAVERGLICAGEASSKKAVRDRIRLRKDGETEWQQVQGMVYGPRMGEARLIDGMGEFLTQSRQCEARVFIVSHKTEYARFDPTHTPLREAAVAWMEQKGFFAMDGLGLGREDVYFEATRQEKIARIRQLGCTHFIDDLEEVFCEGDFPLDVEKILFTSQRQADPPAGVTLASSWQEITARLFDGRG